MAFNLHVYDASRKLLLLEHLDNSSSSTSERVDHISRNIVLFIGGLFDTFLSPDYTTSIASLFPSSLNKDGTSIPSWRLLHVQLSSAGKAWGVSSIDRDVEEICAAIYYIRNILYNEDVPIVLMGHSTGCQDIMRYLTAPNPLKSGASRRPDVQGAILQAPVSDRDAALHSINESTGVKDNYNRIEKLIASTPKSEHRNVILPMGLTKNMFGPAPVSIERFLSLMSPGSPSNPSSEDFFSHDLSDDHLRTTFGNIGGSGLLNPRKSTLPSVLILFSDSDEHMGYHIDKLRLLQRWKIATEGGGNARVSEQSDCILNALHDISGDDWPSREAREIVMREKLLLYLDEVVGDVHEDSWKIWRTEKDKILKIKQDDGRNPAQMHGVLKL